MKVKTKADIIKEKIIANKEEILNMEIVRDYNRSKGTPQAETEANAAQLKIDEAEVRITWLKNYLKKEKSSE